MLRRMEVLRRSVELPAPPAEVWAALTRAELFSQWFGSEVELEPGAGARARFRSPDGSERTAVIEVAEERRLLVLRFHPFERDPQGHARQAPGGLIRFLLKEVPGGTQLEIEDSTRSSHELSGTVR